MTDENNSNDNPSETGADENLAGEVRRLSSELETLKENVRKRKRENTALKVLLYTGFALLLVGFIYSNTTLQRVQLQSLEGNVKIFHRQIQRDITALELSLLDHTRKTVREELAVRDAVESAKKDAARNAMARSTLSAMNRLVSHLAKNNPELQIRADSLRSQSDRLLQTLDGNDTTDAESIDGKN